MVDAEGIEDRDDDLPQVVGALPGPRERLDQLIDGLLGIAAVQSGEGLGDAGEGVLLEADAGREAVGDEVAARVGEVLERLVRVAALVQDAGQADLGVHARRIELDGPAQRRLVAGLDEPVGLGGHQAVEEALDGRGRLRADELVDHFAVLERLDRRDALDAELRSEVLIGVGVDLREHHVALAVGRRLLEHRAERAARAAPFGPEVDDHRDGLRPLEDLGLEVLLGDVDDGHVCKGSPVHLNVKRSGEGPSVVLLHGLTATLRYVVMGSTALERSGHDVLAYDARGHGESDPAPDPEAYTYADLAADLERVLDEAGIERAVLAGASMGGHTALRFAMEHPDRVAGLVVITPAYDPDDFPSTTGRWERLSEGLRTGGIEGFLKAYGSGGVPETHQKTIETVIRQRLAAHRHPEAVADALLWVPRSRPFESLDDLESITAPTVVVADYDTFDPGHPLAVGEEYARRIPEAELVIEDEGKSPLAWQGGQLSRVIAGLVERTTDA